MARCREIRPWLYRVAEGEGSPREAMLVAQHVPRCTACRILLAKEHRLAEMLECELEDLPVSEEFVETVMARLPEGPPPTRHRRGRRGLKLAGLGGLIAIGLTQTVARVPSLRGVFAEPSFSKPTLENAPGALETLGGLWQLALVALKSAAAILPQGLPSPASLSFVGLLLVLMTMGLVAAGSLLAVTAGALIRSVR